MKKKGLIVLLIGIVVAPLMLTAVAQARQTFYINLTRGVYPQLEGTKFETLRCLWCHVEDCAGPRNHYGFVYEA